MQADALGKNLGLAGIDVLTAGGVDDEQDFARGPRAIRRLNDVTDLLEFVHEDVSEYGAARGVDDHNVVDMTGQQPVGQHIRLHWPDRPLGALIDNLAAGPVGPD